MVSRGAGQAATVTSSTGGLSDVIALPVYLFAEPMEQSMPDPTVQTPPEADLARLIVTTLNLELAPGAIDPEAPLFGDGLGLDSIDVLELALAISQTYGVRLRSD